MSTKKEMRENMVRVLESKMAPGSEYGAAAFVEWLKESHTAPRIPSATMVGSWLRSRAGWKARRVRGSGTLWSFTGGKKL